MERVSDKRKNPMVVRKLGTSLLLIFKIQFLPLKFGASMTYSKLLLFTVAFFLFEVSPGKGNDLLLFSV